MNNIFLGLDIGGTKVEAAIARVDFTSGEIQVLAKKRILVKTNTNFIELICDITELIQALLTEAALSIDALTAIGAGLPGSIDPVTQKMLNGNTRYLIQQDFISALQASLQQKIQSSNNKQIPIFIQNDANLFIYAESIFGRGKSYEQDFKIPRSQQVAIGITLGTGVGGGFVTQGKILNGAHGAALEVGHISLNPQGPLCYCGQRGCAETYLSGTALSKLPPFHDSRKLFSEQSHPEVKTIFSDYRKHMVHFLSVLNNLFNPHYIVFGGGLSLQPSLFLGLKAELEKNIFLPAQFCPEIYTQQLGDSAAIFGAMAYANEKNSGL